MQIFKNILILTKNYPPQIGGIEKYSHDLYERLIQEWKNVKLIAAWPRNEWLLIRQSVGDIGGKFWKVCYIFSEVYRLFLFTLKSLTLGFFHAYRSDLIWAMDGSIAGLAVVLGSIMWAKTRVTVHGTDIVWNNPLYQYTIPSIINLCHEIYAISDNTQQECLKRHISQNKIILKPHTHESISYTDPWAFDRYGFLQSLWVPDPHKKIILFSIGRWIERKGFHWFLENIMPILDSQKFYYILAGFWPQESLYTHIIQEKKLLNVLLLGKIDDDLLKAKLYTSSDIFIMPNILVEGNIEWYPLVLLEAEHFWLKSCLWYVQGVDWKKDLLFCENNPEKWLFYLNNF